MKLVVTGSTLASAQNFISLRTHHRCCKEILYKLGKVVWEMLCRDIVMNRLPGWMPLLKFNKTGTLCISGDKNPKHLAYLLYADTDFLK